MSPENVVFLLNVTGQTFRGKQNINSNNIEVGYIYIIKYIESRYQNM